MSRWLPLWRCFFVVLCGVSFNFMNSVQNSLWENSVKNMLESTVRGADQLERGYLKELEMLRMLAEDLAAENHRMRTESVQNWRFFFQTQATFPPLFLKTEPAMWITVSPLF